MIELLKTQAENTDTFLSLYSKIKKEITIKKLDYKEKYKHLAITDPEQYAKLKRAINKRKREKEKERIQEMKAGTYIPKKKKKKFA